MLVTIDPGEKTGWAFWSDDISLRDCGLGDPIPRLTPLARGLVVWIEDQVIYPRSKVDPNDILTLAKTAAMTARDFEKLGAVVEWVAPARWKGQRSKDTVHAAMWSKLDTREKLVVDDVCRGMAASKRHNVLDAVAIGVWLRSGRNRP